MSPHGIGHCTHVCVHEYIIVNKYNRGCANHRCARATRDAQVGTHTHEFVITCKRIVFKQRRRVPAHSSGLCNYTRSRSNERRIVRVLFSKCVRSRAVSSVALISTSVCVVLAPFERRNFPGETKYVLTRAVDTHPGDTNDTFAVADKDRNAAVDSAAFDRARRIEC